MKKILRILLVNYFALWLVAKALPGALFYAEGSKTILLAAGALTFINYLVRPIIKLLLLPITILTLGLFRWVINVLGLYLATFVVKGFSVQPFDFPGLSYQGFAIPAFHAVNPYAYIIVSFALSLATSFVYWLIKK